MSWNILHLLGDFPNRCDLDLGYFWVERACWKKKKDVFFLIFPFSFSYHFFLWLEEVLPSRCRVFFVTFRVIAIGYHIIPPVPRPPPGKMMDMMYRWGFVHRPWRCHRHAGDNSRGYYGRWGRSSRIGVSMMMHRRWNNTTRKNNKKFSLWKAEISLKSRTVYNLRIFTLSIWMADEIASDFNFAFVSYLW